MRLRLCHPRTSKCHLATSAVSPRSCFQSSLNPIHWKRGYQTGVTMTWFVGVVELLAFSICHGMRNFIGSQFFVVVKFGHSACRVNYNEQLLGTRREETGIFWEEKRRNDETSDPGVLGYTRDCALPKGGLRRFHNLHLHWRPTDKLDQSQRLAAEWRMAN